MAVLYVLAGLNHFRSPETYMRIMPPYLSWHRQLVWLSGIAEVLCGILLMIPATRVWGAWCTIALLLAVFPANIQMAVDFYARKNPYLWVAIARLPLQVLLIWWASVYTRK